MAEARQLTSAEVALYDGLITQDIIIPDIRELVPDWPHEINSCYKDSKQSLEQWAYTATDNVELAYSTVQADFVLFAAMCYPAAPKHRFEILSKFIGWLFLFDDEIDAGRLTLDPKAIHAYCKQFIDCSRQLQKLDTDVAVPNGSDSRLLISWLEINKALQSGSSATTFQSYMREMIATLESIDSRSGRLHDRLPTSAEYYGFRLISSATYALLALVDFAIGERSATNESVNAGQDGLADHAAFLVAMSNDIVSFPRELKSFELENAVCLRVLEVGGTAQEAIDHVWSDLAKHVKDFNRLQVGPNVCPKYVVAAQHIVTANMIWSMRSVRYLS